MPVVALAGAVLVWATAWRRWRPVGGKAVGLAALVVLTLVQVRLALPMLGSGDERINNVRAARWVRDNVRADEGVLTDSPGLLRLYADGPAERFVGFGGIAGEDWGEVLGDCRRRGVRYIIWHEAVFEEQGEYYIRKWRLNRFTPLSEPERVAGVRVVRRFEGGLRLWVLEVERERGIEGARERGIE